jgi:hypothetical protein
VNCATGKRKCVENCHKIGGQGISNHCENKPHGKSGISISPHIAGEALKAFSLKM